MMTGLDLRHVFDQWQQRICSRDVVNPQRCLKASLWKFHLLLLPGRTKKHPRALRPGDVGYRGYFELLCRRRVMYLL